VALLSVLRFIPIGVFDDATFRNIGRAFDLACKELNDAGQPDVVHEVMIKRIIAAARRGERDVKRLRDAGLTGLGKPNHHRSRCRGCLTALLDSILNPPRDDVLPDAYLALIGL
jgi:hypothetical protein